MKLATHSRQSDRLGFIESEHDHPRGRISVVETSSTGLIDPSWDKFLQSVTEGQFQQSSAWARYKADQGWRCERHVFFQSDQIIGGFQILWRQSLFGSFGYVSKGPVFATSEESLKVHVTCRLKQTMQRLRLLAVIVQPPDQSSAVNEIMERHGFLPNRLFPVIEATLVNDLQPGMDTLLRRMRRSTRTQIRRGKQRGVVVRCTKDSKDVASFFRMMCASCKRHKETPNPGSQSKLESLMRAFPAKQIRLTIASYLGKDLAGLLVIRFGQHCTGWKKGWSGQHPEVFANRVLNYESMCWAHHQGCKIWDSVAFDRVMAQGILHGNGLPQGNINKCHMFNLGFGGTPVLLPRSKIWISKAWAQKLYQAECLHRLISLPNIIRIIAANGKGGKA